MPTLRPALVRYPKKILILATAFNGLSQRIFLALRSRGHVVSVELAFTDDTIRRAVSSSTPDLIVCPYLIQRIPEDVWRRVCCLIVHPGIEGDRGPSSLDWAILGGEATWGVTVLQADAEYDAGDIWASETFRMRRATKASVYRNEVSDAALRSVVRAVEADPAFRPRPLTASAPGRARPPMKQIHRRIDWACDDTETILRKIASADSTPGLLDEVRGIRCFLYGAHREAQLTGPAGAVIATRDGAICRATRDGAVWITHLKRLKDPDRTYFKLPATEVVGSELSDVPRIPLDPFVAPGAPTFQEIRYREGGGVGWLSFDFYGGAMGTRQCQRLTYALRRAKQRDTNVIVLAGGSEFWSNGIHLNLIEAAADPAAEAMRNLEAINDFVHEILTTQRQLTVTALRANAGAGGGGGGRRRGRGAGPRGRRPQPPLPDHGPARIGVLDLRVAPAGGGGGGPSADPRVPARQRRSGGGDGPGRRGDRRGPRGVWG